MPANTKHNRKSALLLILGVLLVAACDAGPDTAQRPQRPAPAVETATAVIESVSLKRAEAGTLESSRSVRVFNQEPGRILELPYREGDAVAQGDVLVQLDDTAIRAELKKALAARRQAEIDLRRLEKLPSRLASEDEIARARTAVDLALAEETLQRTRLDHTRITAPFAGLISERRWEPGDVAPLHSHILTLIDPNALRIKVSVPERLLSPIRVGDGVTIRIDALGEAPRPGHVTRIHPTIDPLTRRGTLEVVPEPIPPGALPGQLCRVELALPPQERLLIPNAALRHDAQGAHVYAVDDQSRVSRLAVYAGAQIDARVEILQGLEAGRQVVVKGFTGLREGATVRILTARSDPPGKE